MISRYLLFLLSIGLSSFAYAQDTDPITIGSAVTTIQVADDAPEITEDDASLDSGNTAWMLTATALVLFMTLPGLALFYGGLVPVQKCSFCFDALFRDRMSCFSHLVCGRLQSWL